MTTASPSIAKPGEKLVATESGSCMDVEIYETYVVKRLHGRDPLEETPTLEDVERMAQAVQAAKAGGVTGILACEFDAEQGELIEERAPGVALNVVAHLLSPEEIVHVYRETTRTGEALWDWGVYLDRSHPANTYFDRETGRVTQIDLHDGREYDPERDNREALGDRVVEMIGLGLASTTILSMVLLAKRLYRQAGQLRAEGQMNKGAAALQRAKKIIEWVQGTARDECAAYVRRIVEQSGDAEPLEPPPWESL